MFECLRKSRPLDVPPRRCVCLRRRKPSWPLSLGPFPSGGRRSFTVDGAHLRRTATALIYGAHVWAHLRRSFSAQLQARASRSQLISPPLCNRRSLTIAQSRTGVRDPASTLPAAFDRHALFARVACGAPLGGECECRASVEGRRRVAREGDQGRNACFALREGQNWSWSLVSLLASQTASWPSSTSWSLRVH